MNLKFAILIFLFALFGSASAQQNVYQVRGRLVDPNGVPIQFAHVININKSTACISDTAGVFRIIMLKADTVKISCIGFYVTGFSLSSYDFPEDDKVVEVGEIELKPRVYLLGTVNVFEQRWKDFVYDYEQIEPKEKTYFEKNIDNWKSNLINLNELQQIATAARGGGFALNFDRKRSRAIKKVNEAKRQEVLDKEAYEKYNPTIISDITGMSIEDAQNFMAHFNLDRDFILRRNDYDLYLIIKQLYKEYKP